MTVNTTGCFLGGQTTQLY